ncbi:MAG: YdiY family protein [Leptospirillia bacterium]
MIYTQPIAALLALAILVIPLTASAQVNMERFRKGADSDGVQGSAELYFSNSTGNTDLLSGGASARAGWRKGPRLLLLVADASVGKQRDDTTINRGFAHLRLTRDLKPRLAGELFTQHGYDKFSKLSARTLVGAGPRFTLVQREVWDMHLGIAYMLEREVLNVPPGGPDDDLEYAHRMSAYLAVRADTAERLSLTNTVYLQPRIDEVDDMRVLEEFSARLGVAERLGFKISLSVRYDGAPPVGVKEMDTTLTNRLVWDF